MDQLNVHGYAGTNDWELQKSILVFKMGEVESAILAAMPGQRISEDYLYRFSGERSREVVKIELKRALKVFNAEAKKYQ